MIVYADVHASITDCHSTGNRSRAKYIKCSRFTLLAKINKNNKYKLKNSKHGKNVIVLYIASCALNYLNALH